MTPCSGSPSRSASVAAHLVLCLAALALAACGESDESDSDGGDDRGSSRESNRDTEVSGDIVGSFIFKLVPPAGANKDGHTQVVGKVYDGVTPESIVWEEAQSVEGCRLLIPRVPFCAEPCGGSAVCVENDVCAKYPTARAVGTVKIKGVKTTTGATEFTMKPIVSSYQPTDGIKLPFPAFAEGDKIRLEGVDSDRSTFRIEAEGIAPLKLPPSERRLERDRPFALEWDAPGESSNARMLVRLDISHHGGTKGKIECDVEDSGELEMPAEMVTMLLDLGVSGFPTVIMTRESIGKTKISYGVIALQIESIVEAEVIIPGLTSCSEDKDCPSGQTCQTDFQCK